MIGNSMGGMHSWIWGVKYPQAMDALAPMAAQPTVMASRNWMLRRMMLETIRNDPDYNRGNYIGQPRMMEYAINAFALATTGGTLALQAQAPTAAQADKIVDDRLAMPVTADANDFIWQWERQALSHCSKPADEWPFHHGGRIVLRAGVARIAAERAAAIEVNRNENDCGSFSPPCAGPAGGGGGLARRASGFSCGKRVFASLFYPDRDWGMVKLTPEQQEMVVGAEPEIFRPVSGGWGKGGATNVRLAGADTATLKSALTMAWQNLAPKPRAKKKS